jgi:hypothetical protein
MSPPKQERTKKPDGETIVTQMLHLVHKTAIAIGQPVVVALDAYFSSKAAWAAADEAVNENSERLVEIVTRAQSNTVAYAEPKPPSVKKRGRPQKYGEKILLYSLFTNMSRFTKTSMNLYGSGTTTVGYTCRDLLWKPVKKLVRFVAVDSKHGRCVLMSTSLTLTPEQIITIYALRFKIETSFNEQKNEMGCFAYRFWTAAMPKFRKWKNAILPSDANDLKRINNARRAAQSFVCLTTIAAGLLTVIAFSHSAFIWKRYSGWLRTIRVAVPSISVVREILAHDFNGFLELHFDSPLARIILPLRRKVLFLYDNDVA